MKNTDPRIDSYIARAPGFAKPILRHLRKLVHEACPDVHETMKWSSPTFLYGGRIMAGMAAFKQHCMFGFWHQGIVAVLGSDGRDAGTAMGSLGRITSLEDLPPDKKMAAYLKKAAASSSLYSVESASHPHSTRTSPTHPTQRFWRWARRRGQA
jgi:hypothetical protein